MRREAEPQPGAPDRRQVGRRQVFLSEMDEVAAFFDGGPPMVVDDELAAVPGADRLRLADLSAYLGFPPVLDAQLHEPDAERHQPGDPDGGVDDEVEGIELHVNTALDRKSTRLNSRNYCATRMPSSA